jgi:hypothetical protein
MLLELEVLGGWGLDCAAGLGGPDEGGGCACLVIAKVVGGSATLGKWSGLTLITPRLRALPGLYVCITLQAAAQVVQVHREAQQGRDARHAVVRLAYNNGLPGEQPVKLDGEAFASLPRGVGFGPVALPAHDLGGVDEEPPVEADEETPVCADDAGQVGAPLIEDSG